MKRLRHTRVRTAVLLLLVLCLILPSVGCSDRPAPEFDSRLNLLSTGGISIFRVVCSQDSYPPEIAQAAERLRGAMEHMLGTSVSLVDDKDSAVAPDLVLPYEILVGKTARQESQDVLQTLAQDEWVVRMIGHKIVVLGETNRATLAAVDHFIENILNYKGTQTAANPTLKIDPDYDHTDRYVSAPRPNGVEDGMLPGAPYGASLLYLVSPPESISDALSLATLQGLAAATLGEHILLRDGAYENYLPYLMADGCTVEETDDAGNAWTFATLLSRYRDDLDGYLLCSSSPTSESAYVAISLARHLNAVVVTEENLQDAIDVGLTCVLDVSDKNDAWLRASQYFTLLDKTLAVEQSFVDAPELIDYAVMTGCYCYYYDGGDTYLHAQKFKFLETGARILVGNGAQDQARMNSLADISLQPLDAHSLTNLSTLSGCLFTAPSLGKTEETPANSKNVHTVCFVMADQSDLPWLMNDFTTDQAWYASELRGDFAMTWGLEATMYDVGAPIMTYLGHTATEQDDFLFRLPSHGYSYSANWSEQQNLPAARVGQFMKKMLLRYAQIPATGGDDRLTLEALANEGVVQGLIYTGAIDSDHGYGSILWMAGKPVVSIRHRMTVSAVDGTPEFIAEAINTSSTNAQSAESYSIVMIDATVGLDEQGNLIDGGDTMAAVAATVAALDDDVEVVTVSEFMARIKANLK